MPFVGLTKAFDTVSWDGLCKIMEKFGCPTKFIAIVCQFYDSMVARVLDNGEPSKAIPVTNGVKQGCILAPDESNSLVKYLSTHKERFCYLLTATYILAPSSQ